LCEFTFSKFCCDLYLIQVILLVLTLTEFSNFFSLCFVNNTVYYFEPLVIHMYHLRLTNGNYLGIYIFNSVMKYV